MMMRDIRSLLAVVGLMAMAVGCNGPTDVHMNHPVVVLTISDVRVDPDRYICRSLGREFRHHAVGFECVITVVNNTGQTLSVTTDYASPFDGLFLVAIFPDGTEEYRRRPNRHTHTPGEAFPLPPGRTTRTVTFPHWPWPWEGPETVEVNLVGGLPGTDYAEGLTSNTITVDIPRPSEQ